VTPERKETPSSAKWLVAFVNAVVEDTSLSPNEKLLLFVLARDCNGFGVCWPSRARLIEKTGLSRGPVKRAMQSLEQKGWLRRTLRKGRHGNDSTLFALSVPHCAGGSPGIPLVAPSGSARGIAMEPRKDLYSSLLGSSLQEIPESPPPKEGGVGGGKPGVDPDGEKQSAELAEAVHIVTAIADEERQVRSAKLASAEFHRLSQALLAKGLSLGLLIRAAEQYRDKKGPFERWDTLRKGVTAIVEDAAKWAREVERRPKKIAPLWSPPRELVTDANGRLVERTVSICVLTPEYLAEQARRLNALSTPEPTPGVTNAPKIDSGRSSPEQRANFEATADVAEGGRR